jgi:hypothetical protein
MLPTMTSISSLAPIVGALLFHWRAARVVGDFIAIVSQGVQLQPLKELTKQKCLRIRNDCSQN